MNEVIEKQLEGDFEKALFSAALKNLEERGNPLRFNNFAYAMRELVRHVMARLAPDDEVRACDWYKEETGRPNGISRRQRVYYAVQGGLFQTISECRLQWGSNSDLRRGDGATLNEAFPFSCELASPVGDPGDIVADENAFAVDTSSWWEGYYDEE